MEIKFHKPRKLHPEGSKLNYNVFFQELSNAQYQLGLLEGSQKKLQDASLLIAPLAAKEATVSSSIEGTQSTVSDVFLYDIEGKSKYPDTAQVSNYRDSMNFAMKELKKGRQFSSHLIKSMHSILLNGVRHKGEIGKFRNDRVWIAEKDGDPIEKAIYVPPEHFLVPDYIEDLFGYLNEGTDSALVKAGIAHYQFEAIHPFNDGNGRIGRLLVPLILYHKNKLSQPILYISGYFDEHREEYIRALHKVDETGNYDEWLAFYLKSVFEQLKETQKLINSIYDLYEEIRTKFKIVKSPYLIPFIEFIFKNPFFTIPMVKKEVKSRTTIINLITQFTEAGIVKKLNNKHHRAIIYVFKPLVDIIK